LRHCDGTIGNNVISGNSAGIEGGGLNYCNGTIQNNIISGNSAGTDGGGLMWCTGTIDNCIIWGNNAPNGSQLIMSSFPTYSCIQDWPDTTNGNITDDPSFVGYAFDTGTWTINALYDTETFQSRLIDTGAAWTIDSLAGMLIRPDTAKVLQYLIVSNTDTTITVWCDVSDSVQAGDSYEIYDYHLQAGSPCIDAGDPDVMAGFSDLDGNFRYVNATGDAGWDDQINMIYKDENQDINLIWKCVPDMGGYEYPVSVPTFETFTVQTRDAFDTGSWQERFTGNVGTWTDTDTAGADKRFYRVYK
jgi:hypothetical protein